MPNFSFQFKNSDFFCFSAGNSKDSKTKIYSFFYFENKNILEQERTFCELVFLCNRVRKQMTIFEGIQNACQSLKNNVSQGPKKEKVRLTISRIN